MGEESEVACVVQYRNAFASMLEYFYFEATMNKEKQIKILSLVFWGLIALIFLAGILGGLSSLY